SRPDDVRIAPEDRQRAERVVRLLVEDRFPRDALIRRLPDATGRRGHVENRRIFWIDLNVVHTPARRRWTDVAEMERVEGRAHDRIRGTPACEQGEQGRFPNCSHGQGERDNRDDMGNATHENLLMDGYATPTTNRIARWRSRSEATLECVSR